MRIGLSYDLKDTVPLSQSGPEDALEEYDSSETVDFVFNIAEGRGNYRSREAQVPSVLEMLDIPYTGSDPQCLAICLDKPLTKEIVTAAGVCTPKWCVIANSREFQEVSWDDFSFPAIIKP